MNLFENLERNHRSKSVLPPFIQSSMSALFSLYKKVPLCYGNLSNLRSIRLFNTKYIYVCARTYTLIITGIFFVCLLLLLMLLLLFLVDYFFKLGKVRLVFFGRIFASRIHLVLSPEFVMMMIILLVEIVYR